MDISKIFNNNQYLMFIAILFLFYGIYYSYSISYLFYYSYYYYFFYFKVKKKKCGRTSASTTILSSLSESKSLIVWVLINSSKIGKAMVYYNIILLLFYGKNIFIIEYLFYNCNMEFINKKKSLYNNFYL